MSAVLQPSWTGVFRGLARSTNSASSAQSGCHGVHRPTLSRSAEHRAPGRGRDATHASAHSAPDQPSDGVGHTTHDAGQRALWLRNQPGEPGIDPDALQPAAFELGTAQWDERPSGVYSMNDATPGDPLEEGWVDDLQDPRARHWRSDNLVYDRDASQGTFLHTLLGGGGGGSGGRSGSGDNGDNGAEDPGSHPLPTAMLLVYAILVAAAGYVWYSLSLAVNEPEVVAEKASQLSRWGKDMLVSGTQRLQRLRQQHSIEAQDSGYRPLCVSTDGHLNSSRRMFCPVLAQPHTGGIRKLSAAPCYDSNFLVLPRPNIESHVLQPPPRKCRPHRLLQAKRWQRRRRQRPTMGSIPEDVHSSASTPIAAEHGSTQADSAAGSARPSTDTQAADSAALAAAVDTLPQQHKAAGAQVPAMLRMDATPFGEAASQELERTSSKRDRAVTFSPAWEAPRLPTARSLSAVVRQSSSGPLPLLDDVLPPDVDVMLASTPSDPQRQLKRGGRRSGSVRKSASNAGRDWAASPTKRRCARLQGSKSGGALAQQPASPLPQFTSRAARDLRSGFYMPDTAQGYMLRQYAHNSSQKLDGDLSFLLDDRLPAHHGDRRRTAPAVSRTVSHPAVNVIKGELQPPSRDSTLRRSHSLSRNLRVNVGSERIRSSTGGGTPAMSESGEAKKSSIGGGH